METLDLTKPEDVVKLMSSSKNETEWNSNCDKAKAANDGYPTWWFNEIVLSGLMSKVMASWKE